MKTTRTLFIHCLMMLLCFFFFVSAYAATETLYYDYTEPSGPFSLSTTGRTTSKAFPSVHVVPIPIHGNISSGTVVSGTEITGKIRLAAKDVSVGSAKFTLTLKKNGTKIGGVTVDVTEGSSLLYATYPVSFRIDDSFTDADDLTWLVEADSNGTDRGMELDQNNSYLVFPLYEFPWPIFLPAMVGHSSFQP